MSIAKIGSTELSEIENNREDIDWLFLKISNSQEKLSERISVIAECVSRLDRILEDTDGEFRDELESRLESVPGLKYFRLIASKKISASLYEKMHARTKLLDRLVMQPQSVQEKFSSNEPIKIYDHSGDHRAVSPLSMTSSQFQQAIDPNGGVRSMDKQVAFLREFRPKKKNVSTSGVASVSTDKKRGGIVVKETGFISKADLLSLLSRI